MFVTFPSCFSYSIDLFVIMFYWCFFEFSYIFLSDNLVQFFHMLLIACILIPLLRVFKKSNHLDTCTSAPQHWPLHLFTSTPATAPLRLDICTYAPRHLHLCTLTPALRHLNTCISVPRHLHLHLDTCTSARQYLHLCTSTPAPLHLHICTLTPAH